MTGAGIFRTVLPIGFTAGGVNCGVRRYRPDLGVIISQQPCVTSAVFTQNHLIAAPIKYCQALLPSTNIRAILTNSGEANAATGSLGELNNEKIAASLAKTVACKTEQVLVASTGVIGKQLSVDKITAAMPSLVNSVSNIAEKFAVAILTTDLVPKTIHKAVTLSGGVVNITGIAKGSGMVHPNMATMLGYLLSDAKLSLQQSQAMLKPICDDSFNMISVDGDTSTNDCVFLMSNGMSGVEIQNAADEKAFSAALNEIAIILAKSIARDGEGATKLIEVNVQGAANVDLAKKIARSITTSPLVKTAINGNSPNWGRILAKLGNENISQQMLSQCELSIQGFKLFAHGSPTAADITNNLVQKMKEDTIIIDIAFTSGNSSATAWGCDLSEKYVEINTDYLT